SSAAGEAGTRSDETAKASASSATTKPATYAVAARYVSVGELLSAISRMYRLVDDDPLKMRAPVREQYVGEMRVGQRAMVRVDAYDREFPGRGARIRPQIDPPSRTARGGTVAPNGEGTARR